MELTPSPANMPKRRPQAVLSPLTKESTNGDRPDTRPVARESAQLFDRGSREYDKPALSLDELVDRLEGRGLVIPDRARARRYLRNIGYFRLSAYVRPFREDPKADALVPGTSFDEVLELYVFDRKLRLLALDALERVEVAIRAALIDHMGTTYDDPHWHLNPGRFKDHKKHRKLIEFIEKEVNDETSYLARQREKEVRAQSKDRPTDHSRPRVLESTVYRNALEHYISEYREPALPPFWLSADLLTLGQLSMAIDNLRSRSDRNRIAQSIGLNESLLTSWLRSYTRVRNVCAHHGRLWNIDVRVIPSFPQDSKVPWLQNRADLNNFRKRRIYAVLVSLQSVLSVISPRSSWANRLAELVDTRDPKVLRGMGFPPNWKSDPFWASHVSSSSEQD